MALDDLFVLIMLGGFIVGIAIVSIHSKRKNLKMKRNRHAIFQRKAALFLALKYALFKFTVQRKKDSKKKKFC